jgi:hypothetical protein
VTPVTGLTYDPGPAREHIKALRPHGIGFRRVAALADVPYSTIVHLLYGYGPGRPMLLLRPSISARILAITPDGNHAPAALVDATAARRRLQGLIAMGWTKRALAARMGRLESNLARVLRHNKITARTDRDIAALADELTSCRSGLPPVPDESTPRARSDAERCRRLARRCGWPPLAAWDDETIGDPAATPAEGWKRSGRTTWLSHELVAEAEELARQGYDRKDAAERLGTTRDAVEKAYTRTRNRAA